MVLKQYHSNTLERYHSQLTKTSWHPALQHIERVLINRHMHSRAEQHTNNGNLMNSRDERKSMRKGGSNEAATAPKQA